MFPHLNDLPNLEVIRKKNNPSWVWGWGNADEDEGLHKSSSASPATDSDSKSHSMDGPSYCSTPTHGAPRRNPSRPAASAAGEPQSR